MLGPKPRKFSNTVLMILIFGPSTMYHAMSKEDVVNDFSMAILNEDIDLIVYGLNILYKNKLSCFCISWQ